VLFAAVALVASALALGGEGLAQAAGPGTPRPFTVDLDGSRGTGTIDPGESCDEGGDGGYWHYDYEAPLPAGVITGAQSTLNGSARVHLDVHSEDKVVRATPGEPGPGEAWLQGTESTITFANQRGTVGMRLASDGGAGCETPHSLAFDGITVSGAGTWEITEATGSYRQAVGDGTATFTAAVAPGADNPFDVAMTGDIAVLQPELQVEPIDSYWAFLGAHYLIRRVTVVYRVTNVGDGDAFGVRLTAASSPTQGVKLIGPIPFDTAVSGLGPVPQHLGDLPAGASEIVRLRWELPNPSGDPPCGLVILGCEFDTTLTFSAPDALDVVEAPQTATVHAKAPDFPPPVVD
jgi:hypothetical protein